MTKRISSATNNRQGDAFSDFEKTPLIEEALIAFLKTKYPNECPNVHQSDREIWVSVGQASVVTYLEHLMNEQLNKDIE